MKRSILFIFILVSCCIQLYSQSALTQKFRKNVPVQLLYFERLYDPNNTQTSKNKLKKTKEFTKTEVDEIFNRLAISSELPSGLGNENREALAHYKVYEISNFNLLGWKFSLVWIPFDENRHMPKNMQPPTRDGAIFYTYTKHLSFNGLDASGNRLAKAGTPVAGAPEINISTADMSAFTSPSSDGLKSVPQVFKADAEASLREQGEADYYALYERLPTISIEYTAVRDKVFAQKLEDQKTGVQANLFMKKEREMGQRLLDEWHNRIDDFLKQYASILTPEASKEIESWHDQALRYIDF